MYEEILLMTIEAIKDHAQDQEGGVKVGLYMALAILKARAEICYEIYEDDNCEQEKFLKFLGLDEDFERKFIEVDF